MCPPSLPRLCSFNGWKILKGKLVNWAAPKLMTKCYEIDWLSQRLPNSKPELHIQVPASPDHGGVALLFSPLQLRKGKAATIHRGGYLFRHRLNKGRGLRLLKKLLPYYFCHLMFQIDWRANVQISWSPGGMIQWDRSPRTRLASGAVTHLLTLWEQQKERTAVTKVTWLG